MERWIAPYVAAACNCGLMVMDSSPFLVEMGARSREPPLLWLAFPSAGGALTPTHAPEYRPRAVADRLHRGGTRVRPRLDDGDEASRRRIAADLQNRHPGQHGRHS